MGELRLSAEERNLLDGSEGLGVQRAMEIVAALGRIYGAEDLVPITHAQIAGVSYKNIGDPGIAFLNEWAEQGARVRVPATLNPMGMARDRWQDWGIGSEFGLPQLTAVDAFARMGVEPLMSCTPYFLPEYRPRMGENLAWSESSAVVFANSVLGARTNREGGPSALAAAIVGRTARYGLHLDAPRCADLVVDVRCPIRNEADFGALSYLVGREVGGGVPWFSNLAGWLPPLPADISGGGEAVDRLKTLGAGLAAYGAVALFHVADRTPEARLLGSALIAEGARPMVIDSLEPAYAAMDAHQDTDRLDMVALGCPHASLDELRQVARYLEGKRVRTRLWITTGEAIRQQARLAGYVDIIEAAGAEVVPDTCAVVAPLRMLNVRTLATNAGKLACYAPAHSGVRIRYGDLEQCLRAAVTGVWGE